MALAKKTINLLAHMSKTQRIIFRQATFEIEVESNDTRFLAEQSKKLKNMAWQPVLPKGAPLPKHSGGASSKKTLKNEKRAAVRQNRNASVGRPNQGEQAPAEETAASMPLTKSRRPRIKARVGGQVSGPAQAEEKVDFQKLLQVVQRIKASPDFSRIEERILSQPVSLYRILLACHFGEEVFRPEGLTAGEFEAITKALGAPVDRAQITFLLKNYSALFDFDGAVVPELGIVLHYRLNEDGRKKLFSQIFER